MQEAITSKARNKVAKIARSAQERFLSQMAAERCNVTVYLVNGIRLEGRITSFDEHVILLEGEKTDHVYKHAVSTIQPATEVAAKSKRGVARAASRSPAKVPPDIEHAAPQAVDSGAPDAPRPPVVVIRHKRRSIKSADDES